MMFIDKNKRKFFRLPVHHLLKYKISGNPGNDGVLSFVRDISAGGTLFHCNESIAPGSILELEISFPVSPNAIKTKAKVLRATPLKKIGGFNIAVKFIDLSVTNQKIMDEKILNTRGKTEEEVVMKILAFACVISAVIAAVLGFSIKFNLLPLILFNPVVWLKITNTLLFFSIAFSLLKNK